jgi:hypothetical protein
VRLTAGVLAVLMASSAMGAQSEAIGLQEAYEFEKPMQCGKHLLPPSTCYPAVAFQVLNDEVKRLQAVEQNAKVAGDRRLIFFVTGSILGTLVGLLLGGYITWLTLR